MLLDIRLSNNNINNNNKLKYLDFFLFGHVKGKKWNVYAAVSLKEPLVSSLLPPILQRHRSLWPLRGGCWPLPTGKRTALPCGQRQTWGRGRGSPGRQHGGEWMWGDLWRPLCNRNKQKIAICPWVCSSFQAETFRGFRRAHPWLQVSWCYRPEFNFREEGGRTWQLCRAERKLKQVTQSQVRNEVYKAPGLVVGRKTHTYSPSPRHYHRCGEWGVLPAARPPVDWVMHAAHASRGKKLLQKSVFLFPHQTSEETPFFLL